MNKFALFLVGCIGARLLLTCIAKKIDTTYLPYIGYITLIMGIGFIFIYMNDLRKIGREAKGIIWWNELRPIHGLLYILFSIYAIKKKHFAWVVLLLDTLLGVLFWYLRYTKDIQFT